MMKYFMTITKSKVLFVSIFPDAVVSYVHHVAEVVFEVGDGESCGSLELASVTINHR